jgi:hypothetical protein
MKQKLTVIVSAIFLLVPVMGLWIYTGSDIPVVVVCVLLGTLILHAANKKALFGLFFIVCLLTEFYYIYFMGGVMRPYHLMAPIMFIFLTSFLRQMFSSVQFLLFCGFLVFNLFSTMIMSHDASEALRCFLLLCANTALSFVTALILISGAIGVSSFKRIVLTSTIISLGWGVIQFMAYTATNVNLGLSVQQIVQIDRSMIPAFTTEADCFGMSLLFPLMLFVPELIDKNRTSKLVLLMYILAVFFFAVSLVRSALYGCIIGLLYVSYCSKKNGQLGRFLKYILIAALIGSIIVFLSLLGIIPIGEIVQNKFPVAFNFSLDHIDQDLSGSYRIVSIRMIIDDSLRDIYTIFMGNGWGQTFRFYGGEMVYTKAGDWLNVFGYGGLFGLVLYMMYTVNAFRVFRRAAMQSRDQKLAKFGEGLMYATVAVFFTSLFTGYFLQPEYWILIGCSIFVDCKTTKNSEIMLVEKNHPIWVKNAIF